MTLDDLGVGPVHIGTVHLAIGQTLTDRQVAFCDGFLFVQTTSNNQTDVVAYPAAAVTRIDDLRPGPSEVHTY